MYLQHGFSILEWLIIISLISIFTVSGIPRLHAFLATQTSNNRINEITSVIRFARNMALRLNIMVAICPRTNANKCGELWRNGMMVFVDNNASGKHDDNEEILRILPPMPEGSILLWKSFRNKQYLQMTSLGQTNNQNGNFLYCPASLESKDARQVIIHSSGRIRMSQDNDGDGIREDSRGRPLNCNP